MRDTYKYLPGLGAYLLERVDEYTKATLDLAPGFDIPLLKTLSHLSSEQLFEVSREGDIKLFNSLVKGDATEIALRDQDDFYENQNPLIKATDLVVEDLVRIYALREHVVGVFLTGMTDDVSKAIKIMEELRQFHAHVLEQAFKKFVEYKNTELRHKNEILEDAQKQASLGHWVYDFPSGQINWSETLHEIFELDEGEGMDVEKFLSFLTPDCIAPLKENMKKAMEAGDPEVTFNFSIVTRSGNKKYISGRGNIDYENEKPVISKGVFQDVSQSRKQYRQLEESQYRLREAQEIARIGSWAFYPGSGKVEWSEEHFNIFGFDFSEEIDADKFFSRIHPQDLDGKMARIVRAVKEKKGYSEDYRIVMDDGSEKWIRSNTKVKLDSQGEVVMLYGTSQDINDVTTAYRKLEKSQDRLKEAQRIAKIGSWELIPSTGKIEWTDEHYLLFDEKPGSKVSEDTWMSKIVKEDRAKLEELTQKSLSSGISYTVRYRIKNRRGNIRWLNSTGHVQKNPETDEIERVYGTTQDVTSIVEKEIQLQKLNETLEERVAERTRDLEESNENLQHFAYVVSHDLKAPLRAIANIANFIYTDYSEKLDAKGQEYLDMLNERTRFMERLISDILEFSRAGDKKSAPEEVDLDMVAKKIMQDLDPAHKIRFESDPLPKITARFTSVYQVFQNILGNAVKHARHSVSMKCIENNGHVSIAVSDDGPGIKKAHYQKIFNIFETLGNEKGGSGVGLAIVKKLVKGMAGDIRVESEEGKGSTFIVSMPKIVKGGEAEDSEE